MEKGEDGVFHTPPCQKIWSSGFNGFQVYLDVHIFGCNPVETGVFAFKNTAENKLWSFED